MTVDVETISAQEALRTYQSTVDHRPARHQSLRPHDPFRATLRSSTHIAISYSPAVLRWTVPADPGLRYNETGAVNAPYPQPNFTPPPPRWLLQALEEIRRQYPHDQIAACMKYSFVDRATSQPRPPLTSEITTLPADINTQWQPRIRCLDCPGKLYTPGPGQTAGNFVVHIKNRTHVERRQARQLRAGAAMDSGGV